ncbi:unnamed protein product [Rotaria sp. Silwood1]|nr:unnamed protein product [Rotaria sp. Silwood1]CAF3555541.1 unnamed protein product [Rotaria sp. Silwood1]CAF3615365.1 unnamed protein product [Rotaria sp. Silwood1]CAF4712401.1 unnamed protein product [Rotaria sp. Silwood1]CAF4772801.1 unnamed protein product [Rotaria sp. Silwood1]
MINIAINLSFRRFGDFVIFYLFLLQSLSYCSNGSTTMHATCGTDVELICPIRSTKQSDEVISWFRPNSSHSRLSFIAIGDILLPEYAANGRFNLISSSSSRLLINNILIEDQGYYTCKSSTNGQHSIKLIVNSHPYLSPSLPILLYPVNRTFTITCSLLCDSSIEIHKLMWFVNGHTLDEDKHKFFIETISFNTQRLTILLNTKNHHFNQTNYTCRYDGKESSILVRRRTKEELHRLPRQEGSSSAYLLQSAYDTGQIYNRSLYKYLLIFLLLLKQIHCAI